MKKNFLFSIFLLMAIGLVWDSQAGGSHGSQINVYETREDFLNQAFDGHPPKPAFIWLRGELKQQVKNILGHRYAGLRIRYWKQGQRTAWILDEIGKEQPITTGILIDNGAISKVKVLVFRESRGGEVRHDFFTRQFVQTRLTENGQLSQRIDGITGATLSVRALKKLARLALYLDQVARSKDAA